MTSESQEAVTWDQSESNSRSVSSQSPSAHSHHLRGHSHGIPMPRVVIEESLAAAEVEKYYYRRNYFEHALYLGL